MPSRTRATRPAMYDTPHIRTGGFGALQVEAITNRPLSIARRHLAASQLRMRDIEPDELSSSEWVRFLVMEERERDRWMSDFRQRRRNSNSSADSDRETAQDKTEEARQEAIQQQRPATAGSVSSSAAPTGSTPAVSLWARLFEEEEVAENTRSVEIPARSRLLHVRRAVTDGLIEAPPTYDNAVRARTPPPAYEPRSDDEEVAPRSPPYRARVRFADIG